MMKLFILSGVCLGSGQDAYPGDGPEVPDSLATQLITNTQAREWTDADTAAAAAAAAKAPAK